MQLSARIAFVLAAGLLLTVGLALSFRAPDGLDEISWLALALAILVAAALLGGHVAARLGQAAILGELLAGVALGHLPGATAFQFIGADRYVDAFARIGMLLLLFEIGLGLSVRDLLAVGPSSLTVALVGTISSVALGTAAATITMPTVPVATRVFLGAALAATSIGVTARVLKELGATRSSEARIVLGAAVVDDVLGLVVLGVVTAWLTAGSEPTLSVGTSVAALILRTVGFLVLAIVLGTALTPTWFRHAARLRTRGALLGMGLCFCFFLSWAASLIGLAALVGAFAAGLVLEDAHSEVFVQRGEPPLGELLAPMTSFLVPVFFVLVGFRTDIWMLAHQGVLVVALSLTIAAVAGKLACVAGVLTPGTRRLSVAVGMMPRGEVALVFAALGRRLTVDGVPLLDQTGYTAIVVVVILTTLLTPPILKRSLAGGFRRITRPAG